MAKRVPPNAGKGRQKGVPNKRTREIQVFAAKLLEDPDYVKELAIRLRRGKAPHVESLLYQYAYGKPKDTVVLTGQDGGPVALIERVIRHTKGEG